MLTSHGISNNTALLLRHHQQTDGYHDTHWYRSQYVMSCPVITLTWKVTQNGIPHFPFSFQSCRIQHIVLMSYSILCWRAMMRLHIFVCICHAYANKKSLNWDKSSGKGLAHWSDAVLGMHVWLPILSRMSRAESNLTLFGGGLWDWSFMPVGGASGMRNW